MRGLRESAPLAKNSSLAARTAAGLLRAETVARAKARPPSTRKCAGEHLAKAGQGCNKPRSVSRLPGLPIDAALHSRHRLHEFGTEVRATDYIAAPLAAFFVHPTQTRTRDSHFGYNFQSRQTTMGAYVTVTRVGKKLGREDVGPVTGLYVSCNLAVTMKRESGEEDKVKQRRL